MDKLERAIRRTVINDDLLYGDYISTDKETNSIGEILKMNVGKLFSFQELDKKKIVYQRSDQVEALHKFRDIRTALSTDESKNVVMVTSLSASSGASYFARNLAAVTSFDSTKTSLLIDCNIDKPNISSVFELQNQLGVLDYIVDETITVDDVIHASGIARYRCIPSGNTTDETEEYFTHPRFKKLLMDLKNRYKDRNIFIDAPPILKSADTRILLEVCDQVIVVIPYGKVGQEEMNSAEKMIPKDKFKGVVLNEYVR